MPNLIYNSEIVASTKSCIGSVSTLYSAAVDMTDCDGAVFIAAGCTQFMPETSAIMHAQCSTALAGTWASWRTRRWGAASLAAWCTTPKT